MHLNRKYHLTLFVAIIKVQQRWCSNELWDFHLQTNDLRRWQTGWYMHDQKRREDQYWCRKQLPTVLEWRLDVVVRQGCSLPHSGRLRQLCDGYRICVQRWRRWFVQISIAIYLLELSSFSNETTEMDLFPRFLMRFLINSNFSAYCFVGGVRWMLP